MPLPVTAVFAAALTALYVTLCLRVIGQRRAQRIALGTGHPGLERAYRAQANCAEYLPLGLILLGLLEGLRAPGLLVAALGLTLTLGRVLHAYGISREPEDFRFRVTGMALTFTMLIATALLLAGFALAG
jgi:uncharacterized membrane protein YecN with MAPEG domain